MIITRNITVQLGNADVFHDVTVDFKPGQITAIIGPNGAGKSSLIKALSGLIQPITGTITVNGVGLSSLTDRERAQTIGYLPQDGGPAWAVTVRDMVSLGRIAHRAHPDDHQAAIDEAMTATDITHLADRIVDTLSGGELARAKIARVMAGKPQWILADEPLANLDPPHQRDVLVLFQNAAKEGIGIITVLHQLNSVMNYADTSIVMKQGKIIAQGPSHTTLTPIMLKACYGMDFDIVQKDGRRYIIEG